MIREENHGTIRPNRIAPFGWIYAVFISFLFFTIGASLIQSTELYQFFIGILFVGAGVIGPIIYSGAYIFASKQLLKLTNCRIYGTAQHDIFGRGASFSIPWGEIESIKQNFLGDIFIRVLGRREPLRLHMMGDATLLLKVGNANSIDRTLLEQEGFLFPMGEVRIDSVSKAPIVVGLAVFAVLAAFIAIDRGAFAIGM